MRVIAGQYKGRKLAEFKGAEVRPTSDMARESLFNILRDKVNGSSFLDAFCGTGAVGIEALSRGAKKVCFNDLSKDSINILRKNLSSIGNPLGVTVKNGDAVWLMNNAFDKFDIIFLDPPYKDFVKKECLTASVKCLNQNGIVVLEDEKFIDFEVKGLILYDKRKYGRVKFSFFKKGE